MALQAPERKEDPALEAAMRPYLVDLTVKEREAVAAYFDDTLPDQRTAARKLGIDESTLRERLNGRGDHPGAVAKVRAALLASLEPDLQRALSEDAEGAYLALRRWLTPSERIREDGTEDPWVEARCLLCDRPLAFWRPNTIMSGGDRFDEPRLLCLFHY
jgi:hypothetical protein